jgi:hypothetical protein
MHEWMIGRLARRAWLATQDGSDSGLLIIG